MTGSWLALVLLGVLAGAPEAPDWSDAAETGVVKILTVDADGSPRETKIWIVVLDGAPYIRTGDTRWYANVERDPDVTLRVGETEHALRAERVTDTTLLERIHSAFREKYGFQARVVGFFVRGERNVMHLAPRQPTAPGSSSPAPATPQR